MVSRQPWPTEVRQQAITLYHAAGIEVAASVTTVPARTIRSWVRGHNGNSGNGDATEAQAAEQAFAGFAGVSDGASGPDKKRPRPFHGWQPRLLLGRLSGELWAALDDLAQARQDGKVRDARDLAVVVGVLTDKSMELAKATGFEGRPDPEAAVAHIHQLLTAIGERR